MSSTKFQKQLDQSASNGSLPEDVTPLVETTKQHAQSNAYRLAFGVTAFPFTDPNPETSNRPLLGIRFDICKRSGIFDTPFYIICKKASEKSEELRIHRHTIPAHIPLSEYEDQYLPFHDEGYGSEEGDISMLSGKKQDLHALVDHVRNDLLSWRCRQEAIELLAEELEVPDPDKEDEEDEDDDTPLEGKYGIYGVSAVSADARFARIVWADGRVGRVKIADDGSIEKAVVFGGDVGKEERMKSAERILTRDHASIEGLVERLKEIAESTNRE